MVDLLVEGAVEEAILRRLVPAAGLRPGRAWENRGRQYLIEQLPAFNRAARHWPILALMDFELTAGCVGDLIHRLLPDRDPRLCLRLAVRASEAWLMADAGGLAAFLRISADLVPRDPDSLLQPKVSMVGLARRSRDPGLRRAMVPRPNSGAPVGPAYTSTLIEFVRGRWDPEAAAEVSPSLRRALAAIRDLAHSG